MVAEAAAAATLDDDEIRCLYLLDERLQCLRGSGEAIAGILVEFVRAPDGECLSPAYVVAMVQWAARHRLLLFEDAVLLGLRCGRPFASQLYNSPLVRPQWIAIGKAFGFSGVVQDTAVDQCGGYDADVTMLNGYITCTIPPIEVLRSRVVLTAIAKRRLLRSAASVGAALRARLRAKGLDVWGVGLALWFDPASGGVQNATTLHNRMLPPLTLSMAESRHVCVRVGLYSHLPSLLNSALGRLQAEHPPPWERPWEIVRWHVQHIARLENTLATPRTVTAPRRRRIAWGAGERV